MDKLCPHFKVLVSSISMTLIKMQRPYYCFILLFIYLFLFFSEARRGVIRIFLVRMYKETGCWDFRRNPLRGCEVMSIRITHYCLNDDLQFSKHFYTLPLKKSIGVLCYIFRTASVSVRQSALRFRTQT